MFTVLQNSLNSDLTEDSSFLISALALNMLWYVVLVGIWEKKKQQTWLIDTENNRL